VTPTATRHGIRERIHSRRTIFVVLVIVGASWAFVELADAIDEKKTHAFDEWALRSLRRVDDPRIPRGPAWLVQTGRDLTSLGGTSILLLAVTFSSGYLALRRKPVTMALVLASGIGAMIVNAALKYGYGRERPELVLRLMEVSTSSFPSGHAMSSAAVYLSLGLLLAKVQERRRDKAYILATAMFLTLIVGLTRIYLGVHYPTDVLAGWMAGVGWALACSFVAEFFERRGQLETT
jgi:undecaprenyl-diphosphatase